MKGYFENEEKNKEAFDEGGWLRTGDIGYYTEEEFVFTVDRIKEIIKYNGFQVIYFHSPKLINYFKRFQRNLTIIHFL